MDHMGNTIIRNALSDAVTRGVVGFCSGIALITVGMHGLLKVSLFCAEKEKGYPSESWSHIACKIAKWASLSLAGLAGTVGGAISGTITILFIVLGGLGFRSLAVGVISAVILEAYVIKTITEQVRLFSHHTIS